MKKQAKLLYIVSMGHTGSTLLDLLCGTIPECFSTGEAHFLSWQLLQGEIPTDPQTYCSCGENFKSCSFWGKLLSQINQEKKVDVFKNPKEYDFSLNHSIYRGKSTLRNKILNKLLKISLQYRFTKFLSYIAYYCYLPSIRRIWNLFDRVAEESKSEYVIDSSKSLLRFWLLQMHRPNRVKLIVLIRDIKGVASSSHYGLNQEMIDERAKSWLTFYNKTINPIFKYLNKNDYTTINYEDLCQNPAQVKKTIADLMQISIRAEENIVISPYKYHTIQGNPIRLLKQDIEIRYDQRWKERLNDKQIRDLEIISEKLNPIIKKSSKA